MNASARSQVALENWNPGVHEPLVRAWLRQPHVRQWWGETGEFLRELADRAPDSHAVISNDHRPVGYLCWQVPGEQELADAGLEDLPKGLIDIDIMIGERDALGRGIGTRALGLLLDRLRIDPAVEYAGMAVSVFNARARRAYEKAGFRLFREFDDPESGRCLYLLVDVRRAA